MEEFNGVKVFSATKHNERQVLGEQITEWLRQMQKKPGFKIVDKRVSQSSDSEFHCVVLTFFYYEPVGVPMKKLANVG